MEPEEGHSSALTLEQRIALQCEDIKMSQNNYDHRLKVKQGIQFIQLSLQLSNDDMRHMNADAMRLFHTLSPLVDEVWDELYPPMAMEIINNAQIQFMEACRSGAVHTLQAIARDHPEMINFSYQGKWSPPLKFLPSICGNVDVNGHSPFQQACYYNHIKVLDWLHRTNPSLTQDIMRAQGTFYSLMLQDRSYKRVCTDEKGETHFSIACHLHQLDILDWYLQHEPNITNEVMTYQSMELYIRSYE